MFLQLLFFLELSRLTLITSSASPLLQVKPGCQANCGNVTVTYPFGIGPKDNGCSFTGDGSLFYNITCDTSYHPPKPFLWLGTNQSSSKPNMVELLSISETEVRVRSVPSTVCYEYKTGKVTLNDSAGLTMDMTTTPFTVSSTKNKFFGLGCYSVASLFTPILAYVISCMTVCDSTEEIANGICSRAGCCQADLPKGIKTYSSDGDSFGSKAETISFSPCRSAFIGEFDHYRFNVTDLNVTNFSVKERDLSLVLDWAIGDNTCEEAQKNLSTFACQKESNCRNSEKVPGYLCTCNEGFEGNPYLTNGCQDADECKDNNNNPCDGICINTVGSYNCTCPEGTWGAGRRDGVGCMNYEYEDFRMVKIIVGTGSGVLFLIAATLVICLIIRRRKKNTLKKKKFQQNGGLFLQQKISAHEGGGEATKIFTAKELEYATKNFSDKFILGQGGFGTVYKGTLSDERIVAVKKSKIVDDSQIEQFINEIVILTQVNHRNVVKVLGCCLEADVPLLVYEYVSNGTLFQHIHDKVDGETSYFLPWKVRLRIATESAGALAYLHSAASIPIIHRDIKSANILLDENYTAKIADFGGSRLNSLDQTQIDTLVQGTLGYLDPEYFITNLLTNKSDVYSFGVVLLELLTGEKPLTVMKSQEQRSLAAYFIHAMEKDDLFQVIEPQIANEGDHKQITAVAELAKRCLYLKGGERPTMKEVAAELECLIKMETHASGVHIQRGHERKFNILRDEQTELYNSVPISSYNSGESSRYSTERLLFTSINIPR